MRSVDIIRRSLFRGNIWHSAKSLTVSNLYFSTCAKRHSVHKPANAAQSIDGSSIFENRCKGYCLYKVPHRTMAGHSHWSNIKHIKEAADSKHMAVVQSYVQRMKTSIKGNKQLSFFISEIYRAQHYQLSVSPRTTKVSKLGIPWAAQSMGCSQLGIL